jgi:hypothetical protein
MGRLKTHEKNGLETSEVESSARENAYGTNENAEAERKTFCEFAWEAM